MARGRALTRPQQLFASAWFLEANGLRFCAPEQEVVLQTLGLAAGEISEADDAAWLEASCRGE